MGKITIRPTYPKEFSIGILMILFVISGFLSQQIFKIPWFELNEHPDIYLGMFLVCTATIIVFLIIWEEFLFPIQIKEIKGGMIFRNHRTKLKTQILFYCIIPIIFTFLYIYYEVNIIPFSIWALLAIASPVLEKIISGINNYNDYLTLTQQYIEYKNNEKEGNIKLSEIKELIKNNNGENKIKLILLNDKSIIIDLDEMELYAYYESINKFIDSNYQDKIAMLQKIN